MIKDRNIAEDAMIQVHKILGSAGMFLTGELFWVGTAATQTFYKAQQRIRDSYLFTSLDTAIGSTVAGRGDMIALLPEYAGTVTSAGGIALDVANVTVLFLGHGDDKAKITFGTVVGADINISANNITLLKPKFVAGLDSLTGPIDVGATDFTIINGEYYDASNIETIDCVVADNTCQRLTIDGWKFHSVTETADLKQSNILVDGVDDLTLKNIDIRGDFEQGCIENSGDECLGLTLEDIYCRNLSDNPEPAILLDANCTGVAKNVKLRVYSGSTYTNSYAKISWDKDCEGFMGDGYAGEPLGTVLGTGIEGQLSDIHSDTTVLETTLDAYHSDLQSDIGRLTSDIVNGLKSDLTVLDGIADTIASDLIVLDTVADTIASDLTVLDGRVDDFISDFGSNMTRITSDIVNGLKSDLTVLDTVADTIASDLIVLDTVADTIASDLTVLDGRVDDFISDFSSNMGRITSDIVNGLKSDLTVLDGIADTIASDLIVLDTKVDSMIDAMQVAKMVSDACSGATSDSTVVNISDVGVLTGITQMLTAVEAATGTLAVRIDGSAVLSNANATNWPHASISDVVVASFPFNHPFDTSLNVKQQKSVASGTVHTVVTYTTD